MIPGPAVSILIPAYNYAGYMAEALDSVLAQTFRDLEVIVADDASTDGTAVLCRDYAARDQRIRFHQHPANIGMVENWNWLLGQARGRYVKFLLADDALAVPHALERFVSTLDANPGSILAASARVIIDEASQAVETVRPLGRIDRVFSCDWLTRRFLDRDARHINSIGEPSAVMFRRDASARGFDTTYRQLVDLEMWFHLLQQGDLVYIAEPLCNFRRHDRQQTEVNRGQCRHQQEEVELCLRYGHPDARKRVLFRKMYRMAKVDRPEYRRITERIRGLYTPGEYARHYAAYKLVRPFENLYRSVMKRCAPQEDEERI